MNLQELLKAINEALAGDVKLDDLVAELAKKDSAGAAYGIHSKIKDSGHKDQAAKTKPKIEELNTKVSELEASLKEAQELVEASKKDGGATDKEIEKRDAKIEKLSEQVKALTSGLQTRDVEVAMKELLALVYPGVREDYRRVVELDLKDRVKMGKKGIEYIGDDGLPITEDSGKSPAQLLAAATLETVPATFRLTAAPDGGGGAGNEGGGGLPGDMEKRYKAAAEAGKAAADSMITSPDRKAALDGIFGSTT